MTTFQISLVLTVWGFVLLVAGIGVYRQYRRTPTLTTIATFGSTEKGWRTPPGDNTLGWRGWRWNEKEKCLESPVYNALWRDGECRVENWDDQDDAVRNRAGIHALWPVPKGWQDMECRHAASAVVVGIVERYGHYILGEDGWRAEWVVIRELAAHKSVIEDVRKAYPDITVHERTVPEADSSIIAGGTLFVNAASNNLTWVTMGGGGGGGGGGLTTTTHTGSNMVFYDPGLSGSLDLGSPSPGILTLGNCPPLTWADLAKQQAQDMNALRDNQAFARNSYDDKLDAAYWNALYSAAGLDSTNSLLANPDDPPTPE